MFGIPAALISEASQVAILLGVVAFCYTVQYFESNWYRTSEQKGKYSGQVKNESANCFQSRIFVGTKWGNEKLSLIICLW